MEAQPHQSPLSNSHFEGKALLSAGMIRHIVLLTWREGTTDEQHQAVVDQLVRMPEIIPEIKSYALHSDAGIAEGNADLLVVGEFENAADYRTYATNTDHVDVISTYVKPILAGRSAIQHEM